MSLAETGPRDAVTARRPADPAPDAQGNRGLLGLDMPPRLRHRLHRLAQPPEPRPSEDPAPSRAATSLVAELRSAGILSRVLGLLGVTLLTQGGEILGWGVFGGAVLNGQPALWGIWGWLLLLATTALIGLGAEALIGEIAIRTGGVIKRRLALGALGLDLDILRRLGPSSLVITALEAEALEQNGLGSALGLISGVVELSFLVGLCLEGAGGALHLAWLLLLLALIALAAGLYARSLVGWTEARLAAGTQLIEAIAGHRIWRTQWHPARRQSRADAGLASYARRAADADRKAQWLLLTLPSLWTLGSLLTLLPAAATGHLPAVAIAISIGAILLGARAINLVVGSLAAGLRAGVAARQLRPLLRAAEQQSAPPPIAPERRPEDPVFAAEALSFTHHGRRQAVLDGLSLTIRAGDRLLVEGAAGSGKSTLGAILSGLRHPDQGLMTRRGRQHAMAAPQFQDNHLFAATVLQNLYPTLEGNATPVQLSRASALLDALGLGDLITRMPLGLLQRIGSGGWALSQGERSRLCLARALLADADLLVLDESLGALDPLTAARCLAVATAEARALVMIAHP